MSGPVHTPRARRSRGRRIALIVWLVVLLLVAVPTVWAAVSYAGQPEDQRVPSGGGDVVIGEPGEYAVYAETTIGTSGTPATVRSLTAPSGATVPVTRPGFSENYTSGSRTAVRVGTFTAVETGSYRIVGENRQAVLGDQLVVGTRTVGSVLGIVGGAIATGVVLVVGLVAGLVVLLAGRRRLPPPRSVHGCPPPRTDDPYGPPSAPPRRYGTPPYPAAQEPDARYPAAQHPAAQHPAAQHPAAQHPAAQHPAAQHPGPQEPSRHQPSPYANPTWSGPSGSPPDDPTVSARRPGEPSGPDDRP